MKNKRSKFFLFSLSILFLALSLKINAQPEKIKNAAEIKLALDKLNVVGSVLYIAAHPDDENTAFLSYCASGKLLETAYLALTRGDGGQNLLGSEQSEELSVIRTQELLAARRIDGAQQFFSRAIDFGYSKNAEETLDIWKKEKILSDVVWVIRKFKPDVIVLRFPGDGRGGHGNHTASAILAKEAFKIANDPKVFPEQLKYVKPWQPKRLFWNSWTWRNAKIPDDAISIDLGEYNPLLGKSYTEIAAESRSMHKSQGFGSAPKRGENLNYFQLFDGPPAKDDLFENIKLDWSRVPGSEKLSQLLKKADKEFNPENPSAIIPILIQAYAEMEKINDTHWIPIKKKELLDVLKSAAGLWIEANSDDFSATPGDSVNISASIVNRSNIQFSLKNVKFKYGENENVNLTLNYQDLKSFTSKIKIPTDAEITEPYWLMNDHEKGTYNIDDQNQVGKPDNDPPLNVTFTLSAEGEEFDFTVPVLYKWTDPVTGENYKPFEIRPPLSIQIGNNVYVFPDDNEKEIKVDLVSNTEHISGKLTLNLPEGWNIEPKEFPFELENKNEEKHFTFMIKPPLRASVAELKATAETNHGEVDRGIETINYSHIPVQTLFPKGRAKMIRLDINKTINNIGYIIGAGDVIPGELEDLGYNVHFLSDEELDNADLSKFDAIIAGVRAYNTRDRLAVDQKRLMEYVKNGGTYLVQYNNSFNMVTKDIGPYPIELSHDRVTVEEAPVEFVDKNNVILNSPNKITQKDFEDWIQERGLYFADKWDNRYQPVISSHDPGEKPLQGGLLFTKYGEGVYIYTGYAWFRQLPAGVPGAFRIFINLISSGKSSKPAN
ncbi:MAG TPA: PIG-L family deacetylase [Ignavibacteriaceae bacterium]|nr:PIG-L family deacetylase [Ignavibacteriaceae bacterium]